MKTVFFSLLMACALLSCGPLPALAQQGATSTHSQKGNEYFVDCGSSAAAHDGRSPATAWRSLDEVNAHTFVAGDAVRLKRGTTCGGMLGPKGSGSATATIHLSAYGSGARPKVVAKKGDEEAFRLFNQEYWDVDSIEFSGGTLFGVYVSGDAGILHHVYLRNLVVHDVYGGDVKHKESGLVVISPGKVEEHFDDVLVEGVTAYGTDQWAGILVGGGNFGDVEEKDWSTRVVVRNSTVHDLFGDGIILFRVKNGLIDSSAAWRIGMQPTQSIGTPNAIWTWMCQDCTVSNNEAFLTDSPGVDGGAFDIDWGNTRNSVIGNYGHDTQGYCIAVFAAGYVTHDSVVEQNLCVNNGESPRLAQLQGAFFIYTWNSGVIDNLRIEKNTIDWSPPGNFPALVNRAEIQGAQKVFGDNQIASRSVNIIESKNNMTFAGNHYATCRGETASWTLDGQAYTTLEGYRKKSGQEQGSSWTAEKSRDSCLGLERNATGRYLLQCELPANLDGYGLLDFAAAGQLSILRNLEKQFAGNGLTIKVKLAFDSSAAIQTQDLFKDIGLHEIASSQSAGGSAGKKPRIRLLTADGSVAKEWEHFVGPAELGRAIRQALGRPDFSAMGSRDE